MAHFIVISMHVYHFTTFLSLPLKVTNSNITDNEDLHFYQMVYGLLMLGTVVLAAVNVFFFTSVTLNAACKLHNSMFKRVLSGCRRRKLTAHHRDIRR